MQKTSLLRANLPAALLGIAAMVLVVSGALILNHQLRDNERSRALGDARQLAFGFSRDATEHFWRFREEFIFSLTHLPYERFLTEVDNAPDTLVTARRFLSINQDILAELYVSGPDGMGRTMQMKSENYVVFSPLQPIEQLPKSDGGSGEPVAIKGIVQASDGSTRATVTAVLDPEHFWRDSLTSFSISHPSLWVHLLDNQGRAIFGRHGATTLTGQPKFTPEVAAQLAADAQEGYEGRIFHRVEQQGRKVDFISAYVPLKIESWSGLLLVSADESVVLGPAAKAIGTLTIITTALFLLLFALFAHFIRATLRSHNQLEVSRREAEEAAREAEAANRAKSAFLAMMSHELRTPLNSIMGLSESLLERLHGPLTEKQARYVELVLTSGRHLLNLINDILDLAKIESGRFEGNFTQCELGTLCDESLAVIQPMVSRRRQVLDCDLAQAKNLKLRADARLLLQLMVNLLGNAVKFTPEGGMLGLRVLRENGDRVIIQIWDRGIGISPEDQARLFQPFVQLDARLSRNYEGTGLGLALVKQIAVLHGGDVSISSRRGEGSVFSVRLPILPNQPVVQAAPAPVPAALAALVPAPVEAPSPAKQEEEPVPAVSGPHILVVDDIPFNIIPIRDYLEKKGCRVTVAENGRLAVEKTRQVRPDLILMDIQMPEMDGLEATRLIRAFPDPVLSRVPVFAVTAMAMPSDRQRCQEAGMDEFISKPYSPHELHTRILARLAGAASARA